MKIQYNFSLKHLNSFGLDVKAEAFVSLRSVAQLQQLLQLPIRPLHILGGGSNILLTKDLPGLVIHNQIMGKAITRCFPHSAYIAAGAGENWHQLVLWCIGKGLGGIENLSLIPGTVGAAPIQNIGAYGVELKEVFHKLEAVELSTGKLHTFRKTDCQFGYRDSIFKRLKDHFCITKVWLKLSLRPKINTSYGAILDTLAEMEVGQPGIRELSDAVIRIRSAKLPDPTRLGNAGSFFKNPVLSATSFQKLVAQHPKIPHYPLPDGRVKIPAGWLIEQCGWKGRRVGQAGAHAHQALVLVNYGGASGAEIQRLAFEIIASVADRFGIHLLPEVNIW